MYKHNQLWSSIIGLWFNNNNQFLYSAFHNNRINALYISALVIGPITSLFNVSQLPWEYTTWATVYIAPKAFSQVPIYSPGWREAIIVKYLAQGHKCHDRDSNPHSSEFAPELEFDALNHSAMTLYNFLGNTPSTFINHCPSRPVLEWHAGHGDHGLGCPWSWPWSPFKGFKWFSNGSALLQNENGLVFSKMNFQAWSPTYYLIVFYNVVCLSWMMTLVPNYQTRWRLFKRMILREEATIMKHIDRNMAWGGANCYQTMLVTW